MPKESELSKRLTGTIKAVDTLIHDLQTGLAHIISTGSELKRIVGEVKEKFKGPDDKQEK